MRMILSLSALIVGVGAHAAPPQLATALAPSPALNAQALAGALQGRFAAAQAARDNSQVNCRSRIETAREERGLPKLRRDDATPDAPLFIAAVDKTIDRCEVLVMRDNLSDIRPLPEFQEGSGKLTPLTGQ